MNSVTNRQLVIKIFNNLGKSQDNIDFELNYLPKIKEIFEFIFDNPNRYIDFFNQFNKHYNNINYFKFKIFTHETVPFINYLVMHCGNDILVHEHLISTVLLSLNKEFIYYKFKFYKPSNEIITSAYIQAVKQNSEAFKIWLPLLNNEIIVNLYFHFIGEKSSEYNDPIVDYMYNKNMIDSINYYYRNDKGDSFKQWLNPKVIKDGINTLILMFGTSVEPHKNLVIDLFKTYDLTFISKILETLNPNTFTIRYALYKFALSSKDIEYINQLFNITGLNIHDYSDEEQNNLKQLYF